MPLFNSKKYNLDQAVLAANANLYTIGGQPMGLQATMATKPPPAPLYSPKASQPAGAGHHFEIRWDNLSYQVEPKWYQQWRRRNQGQGGGGGGGAAGGPYDAEAPGQLEATQRALGDKKCILRQLNGSIRSGQVTAILGPSGAGKTSLLGCLTGKNKSGVSGSIQVISQRDRPMSICIIPQKDYLLNQLTIRENLYYASRLKNPELGFDHHSNIERVVDLLKLQSCIDTKISKVSGGQYKRVSIAQELLSNPDILILDEPTSGLDSLTCYKTVMVLRDLAKLSPNPMAILVTIHQPQREVFDLFNHVYILAVGGRCIYEGQPAHSIKTINECSGGLHFDAGQYNPASYLVEIASVEFGEKPIEALVEHQRRDHRRKLTATAHAHDHDHHGGAGGDQRDGQSQGSANFQLDYRLQTHKHNHQGHFLRHCQLLTKRSWLCLCKDPMLTTLRFSAHIIVPLLITLVYGNRVGQPNACPLYQSEMDLIDYARHGAKRLLNLQDELRCSFENVGLYFLSVYAFTFSTMCLTSLSFPLNMHVLLKEVRNGWYSIPTYFIGKTLADFPLEFILPTLTLMITYPLTGQPASQYEWRFLLATAIFVVTSLIAQTQGLIFGALFMNAMQAAVFVAPVSTTPLILLSGFLIRIRQMPLYLQQLSNFSYFRYAIESLTIIRYGFGQCPCDPELVNGKPVSAVGVPDQLRTMTNYWLSTFDEPATTIGANTINDEYSTLNETALSDLLVATTTTATATTTTAAAAAIATATTTAYPMLANATMSATAAATGLALESAEQPIDFFQDLTSLLARANSFGADIRTCKDLKPYPMIDFSLDESQLYVWVAALLATLFVSKVANYLVVKYSVKWRL